MNQENLQADLSVKAEINLYYDLYVPENVRENAPLLITVHGYGAHKRYMMREAKLIAPKDFVIVSLQAPNQHFRQTESGYRVGFGWLTDYKASESVALHHKFLLDVIENLAQKKLIDKEKIYLYGFSQACALNFRFAFTFPEILRGVIGICGGVPSDLETNEIYKPFAAKTFYLYSDTDEFYSNERFADFNMRLEKVLPNFQSKKYSAKHEITDEMREDMKVWLAEIS